MVWTSWTAGQLDHLFQAVKVFLHFPKSCKTFLVHHVAGSGPAEQPGSLDSSQQPGASHSLQPQGLNDQQLWPRSAELSFILVIGSTILAGPRLQFQLQLLRYIPNKLTTAPDTKGRRFNNKVATSFACKVFQTKSVQPRFDSAFGPLV